MNKWFLAIIIALIVFGSYSVCYCQFSYKVEFKSGPTAGNGIYHGLSAGCIRATVQLSSIRCKTNYLYYCLPPPAYIIVSLYKVNNLINPPL